MTEQPPPPEGIERRQQGKLYGRTATEITGVIGTATDVVRYRRVLSRRQHFLLVSVAGLHIGLAVLVAVVLLLPGNLPQLRAGEHLVGTVAVIGLLLMIVLQLIVALRTWVIAYFGARACDPVPMPPKPGLRVAVLTTIVPGKEPIELVMTTLRAMKRIRHDGPMDVWLLDEGDDDEVRRRCAELGVRHFSRKGRPEWNQPSGPFKARTKHGNHNAWRAAHESEYDVVAQMDPTTCRIPTSWNAPWATSPTPTPPLSWPRRCMRTSPSRSWRAERRNWRTSSTGSCNAAATATAPLLIGTNHLYRPAAFAQISGYQDCIIEDHLTSMVVYGAVNADTGNHWKGVYTPDIVAVGEGPATYSDFFSQQKRWAYGIWEIARRHSPRLLSGLPSLRQRLAFFALQSHYPTTALSWVIGVALSSLYLIGGVSITRLPAAAWCVLFAANIVTGLFFFQFTQRFNLVEHERRSRGIAGMVLELITAPIYVAAAAAQLAGRPLAYVVTAKGAAATGDTWRTFRPHIGWAAVAATSLTAGSVLHHNYPSLYVWSALTVLVSLAPIGHLVIRAGIRHLSHLWSIMPRLYSVTAQRRIGERLLQQGHLTIAELQELLDLQASSEAAWQRLGDLAIQHGYVEAQHVNAALTTDSRA